MHIALQAGSVGDGTIESAIQYARDLDLDRIVLSANIVPGYRDTGVVDARALKDQKAAVEAAGMGTSTLHFWPPFSLNDEATAAASLDRLNRDLDAMAAAGMKVMAFFSNLNRPVDPADEEAAWGRLTEFYAQMAAAAEERDILLASHFSGHRGRSLLAGSEAYRRLFADVPSPSNGLTMCIGNIWVSDGERIYDLMREFADRIFFMHMRSTKIGWGESPYWWDIPDGPDVRKVMQTLQEIGYDGDMVSEHMPEIEGQNRLDISSAWAIGYMKAVQQLL